MHWVLYRNLCVENQYFHHACSLIFSLFFQLEEGVSYLPLLDPSMRATPLAPAEWKEKLKSVNRIDDASNANLDTKTTLLDVRNGIQSVIPSLFHQF